MATIDYAELHCSSNFSFLEGASHPEELIARAAALGYHAIAITDRDGLYAAVRLQESSQEHGIKPIFGARLTLEDQSYLTLLATSAEGYQNLSQLITTGRRARPKGESVVGWHDLERYARDLIVLSGGPRGSISQALLRGQEQEAQGLAERLLGIYGPGQVYLELTQHLLPVEARLKQLLVPLARTLDLPLVATQEAVYHVPERRRLQDVLTCIRLHTHVQEAGRRLLPNGEYYLQTREVLAHRFRDLPEALRNTLHIAERCHFSLVQLNFSMPSFPVPAPFRNMLEYLEHLTFLYAPARFPEVNARVVSQLRHELEVVGRHGLEGYFLIVWDIMKFCHDQGILAQGRGSAANSAVCFALGITNVDPIHHQLLFERFLSEGRKEAPDIDLDIANDRREEVIQYVYQRYGRDHAGMVCELICFRARSAVRDVGKALGLSLDQVDKLAKSIDRYYGAASPQQAGVAQEVGKTAAAAPADGSTTQTAKSDHSSTDGMGARGAAPVLLQLDGSEGITPQEGAALAGLSPSEIESLKLAEAELSAPQEDGISASSAQSEETDAEASLSADELKLRTLLWNLCQEIEGFPRHLGIHVGGMIICASSLAALVPIENATMPDRTVVQWDKDDVGALKMPKIDLLGLGMLSLMGEALELIQVHEGKVLDPARLSYDDPSVYELICTADTVGVFQVESRAQMNVLPRLKPRCFYDLVVQVSLIRPGPIQGDMVHPYIRRRNGQEEVTYPHPELKPILERTLGVPLFQEQGMKVAITAAGFSPAEADALRRAMGSKRSKAKMEQLTQRLLDGMYAHGYSEEMAQRVVNQIRAFASYGFPESHAASFALLVYISAYLKCKHPLAFYVALLNNQPMGFYSPATIVNEMKRRGIHVAPVDVVRSSWEWTIEGTGVRAGLKSVRGLGDSHREAYENARRQGSWRSVEDFCQRVSWPRLLLERLAAVGGFDGLGIERREALWQVQGFRPRPGLAAPAAQEEHRVLEPLSPAEAMTIDLQQLGHSVQAHPIRFLRQTLDRWNVLASRQLERAAYGSTVRVAGVVTVRQRPPTAKGFCFLTLEDEHGMMNVVVRPDKYQEYRAVVRRAMLLLIEGPVQKSRGVINVMAEKIAPLDERWSRGLKSRDFK